MAHPASYVQASPVSARSQPPVLGAVGGTSSAASGAGAAPLAAPLAAPYARVWPPTPGPASAAAGVPPAIAPSGRACVAGVCCFGPRVDGFCCGTWGRIRSVYVYKGCCAGSWLLILLMFASVFVPLGVGFFAALGIDERATKIAAFNAASAAWPNASLSFAGLTNLTVSGDGGTVSLALVTTLDSYPDADGLVLPTVGLHYVGQSGSASSPVAGANFDGTGGSPTSGSQSAGRAGAAPVANPWTARRFFQRTTCSSSGKSGQSCSTNYWRLSGFCFVLDANLAPAGGCALDGTASALSVAEMAKCDGPGYYTFSVPADVRSPDDPFVVMMRATNGSKNFGITQIAKVICGAVFLAAGALMCASGCLCLRGLPAPPKAAYGLGHRPLPGGDAAMAYHAAGAAPRGAAVLPAAAGVPYAIPVSFAPHGGGVFQPGAPPALQPPPFPGAQPGATLYASALSPYAGAAAYSDGAHAALPARAAAQTTGASI